MRGRSGRGADYRFPEVRVYPRLSLAPIAQSAERLHGKEKVYGSIPYWGSGVGVSPGPGGGHRFRRRGSSGGQSTRLIIVVSRVRVPPPLQTDLQTSTAGQPASAPKVGTVVASKTTDVRPKVTLACTECKERNYITKKNRRNDPDRIELKKFCPRDRRHTIHRETR